MRAGYSQRWIFFSGNSEIPVFGWSTLLLSLHYIVQLRSAKTKVYYSIIVIFCSFHRLILYTLKKGELRKQSIDLHVGIHKEANLNLLSF